MYRIKFELLFKQVFCDFHIILKNKCYFILLAFWKYRDLPIYCFLYFNLSLVPYNIQRYWSIKNNVFFFSKNIYSSATISSYTHHKQRKDTQPSENNKKPTKKYAPARQEKKHETALYSPSAASLPTYIHLSPYTHTHTHTHTREKSISARARGGHTAA